MVFKQIDKKRFANFQTIFLLLLSIIELSNGSVSWSLATKPAVFGKDIELHCNLDDNTTLNNHRHWSKGDNIKVLVVNGKTVNDTKYSEKLDEAKRTSILTITSLESGDVNVPYTCQHGFHTYKKVLNMTVENFEYHPSSNDTIFKQDDDHILFLMKFEKVFPFPACRASIGGKNITKLLNISSVRSDVFYKVEISLKYHHVSKECIHHPFELDCCIGTKTIKQRFETANDVCLELEHQAKQGLQEQEKDQTVGLFGRAIFVVITVVVVGGFILGIVIKECDRIGM
ncbi:uncharacterized protein LOC127718079 [Mytilus californianus]|uniref:uncharacterized protein LOC127718079 n=1 Tax=Mytilus californianus TaxID=6549 RepID=UPI0022486C81|nr:uncharacterized protein LOC127718079 [Mytilus californianus]